MVGIGCGEEEVGGKEDGRVRYGGGEVVTQGLSGAGMEHSFMDFVQCACELMVNFVEICVKGEVKRSGRGNCLAGDFNN